MKYILLDSGHGGLIGGIYQTPGKMYYHSDKSIAYEGEINRKVKSIVINLLNMEGLRYIDICPTNLDISLDTRCRVVNNYCDEYGASNCLLMSLHSNAGNGRGVEIWTFPGQNTSDWYATEFMKIFQARFMYAIIRSDWSDNDIDKEASLQILRDTKCPAILPEWMFFDNYNDWVFMREMDNQINYARMIVEFIKKIQ